MPVTTIRALEIKSRITDAAHRLADLLTALSDAEKNAVAFADAREVRRLAARYAPQASITDEPEY